MAIPGQLFREVRSQAAILQALLNGLDRLAACLDDGMTDHEFIGQAQAAFQEAILVPTRRLSEAIAEMESLGVMDALEPAVWNVAKIDLMGTDAS